MSSMTKAELEQRVADLEAQLADAIKASPKPRTVVSFRRTPEDKAEIKRLRALVNQMKAAAHPESSPSA